MRDSANVLNSLAGHSQDPNYKFERLYRLLFNENLYALAYQKLSQNAGNYTKGTDGQTIDGMSIKHIHSIIGKTKVTVRALHGEFTFPKRMASNVL